MDESIGKVVKPSEVAKLDRLRSVKLPPAAGDTSQAPATIDVKKLNPKSSQRFADTILAHHDAQDDQSKLLDKVRERLEAAGLSPPCVEVRYENLSVEVNTLVASRHIPNLISPFGRGLSFKQADQPRRTDLAILAPCSGVLRPGRLTLVLGPPGSGRTTFLRSLSGRSQTQAELKVSGNVTYNGRSFSEFEPSHAAAYVGQSDLHYGELTVRETMNFAAKVFGAKPLRDLLEVLHDREEELGITPDPAVDAFMKASAWGGSNTVDVERTIKLLGLEKCSDTVVGNQMLRGISGGEKRRVTSGEVLVGPARVLLGDEISTGLDSRTTYDLVKYIRGWVKALNGTCVLALLQPTPETFELFDDVILLNAGMVVYDGPREGVLPFFSSLGFECPTRLGIAEFMQEVTTATDQNKYWSYPGQREYEYVTAAKMKQVFQETEVAQQTKNILAVPWSPPFGDDRLATIPLPTETYGASFKTMWKANAIRAALLESRNKLFLYVRWSQVILMALVTGTLYISVRGKDNVDDGNLIMGALFFSMIYMLMAGSSEMHHLSVRLPVFFRQREMRMYPGSAFALPSFLWRVPYCMVDALLWSLISYFAIGLDPSAGRFFMFVFLMFLTAVWSTSLHQAISAAIDEAMAQAFSMLILMVLLVSGGYIVIKSAIPGAWKIAYYSNPWFYLTQAFAINEFTGGSWDTPYNTSDPNSPTVGVAVLDFRDFQTSYAWVWYGVAIVMASIAINVAVFVLAATYRPAPRRKAFITDEALEELHANRDAVSKPIPASMKRDIEMGVKRSASMAKLNAIKGSNQNLVALAATIGTTTASTSEEHSPKSLNGVHNNNQDLKLDSLKVSPHDSPHSLTPKGLHRQENEASSALPFQPLSLTFKNVGYSVAVPVNASSNDPRLVKEGEHAGQLQLLHNVTGSFRPGVLTALLGASGAGKTTLMDVLAGRKTGGKITGDIRLNGHPKDSETFAHVSAYVEQEDSHMGECTVLEALHFSASLRLPTDVSAETRCKFVDEVLDLMELRRLSDAMIGEVGHGHALTIEQRKRLTIAVELVSNPSILFCDEPTTGLDARGASLVMSTIRATAATGRVVVCTIHQPSYQIFEAFDELIVLKPGGRCIFNGPLGPEASLLISYFQNIPGVEPMKPQMNPANWMLEQTAPRREAELGVDFADIFDKSAEAKQAFAITDAASEKAPGSKPLSFAGMKTPSGFMQFYLILHRLFVSYWRNVKYNMVRFFVSLLVMAVFGSIFYQQGQKYLSDENPGTLLNIAGVIFMSVLFVGATNAMTVQGVISNERKVFYRERAAGMYGEMPFAFAQSLVELPYLFVQSAVYAFPVYYLIGFNPAADKVMYFFLFFFLTLWFFTEFGAACVNLTPELGISTLLLSFIFSFMNLFSGFMIPASSMGWWWRWAVYINPVYWSLYALLASQLGDSDALVDDFGNGKTTVSNFMYERFGYSYSMVNPIIGILIGFVVFFRLCSVYALAKINFQNR